MSLKLYRFYWDCRRMGDLSGLFTATEEEIKEAIGKEVYFGEVLGKHSEIFGTLEAKDFTEVECSEGFAEEFAKIVGSTGYNPLNYLEEDNENY